MKYVPVDSFPKFMIVKLILKIEIFRYYHIQPYFSDNGYLLTVCLDILAEYDAVDLPLLKRKS